MIAPGPVFYYKNEVIVICCALVVQRDHMNHVMLVPWSIQNITWSIAWSKHGARKD